MRGLDAAVALLGNAISLARDSPYLGVGVLLLAVVFMWSGIAKIRRPTLAAMALVDFGIVRTVRPPLGLALGLTECLLAIALVSGELQYLFLTVTTIALWFFVVLIASQLRSGKAFACFCFGEADAPMSWRTLMRTAMLAVLATVLTVLSPIASQTRDLALGALQAVSAVALLGVLVLGAQVPRLIRRRTTTVDGSRA